MAPRQGAWAWGNHCWGELLASARSARAATLALDTDQSAHALIAMHESWSYRVVGECACRPLTNFPSVLMSRPVDSAAA